VISLNFGTTTFPFTREEIAFVAESLMASVSGKPATASAFTSGMHDHISMLCQKVKSAKQKVKKEDGKYRPNPPQSDHVLTGC